MAATLGAPATSQEPTVEVVAEGLHAPRGLAIASDGSLLVAEAGQAGDLCPEGGGGFCLGTTGSVARISDGTVERIVEGLPSAGGGSDTVGVSDIALIDDEHFYLIVNAGGDPAGRQFMPPELATMGWLMRGSGDGIVESVADVAGFETSDDPDAEFSGGVPDANPYSVAISADGGVVVADAAMNALVAVDDAGAVSLMALFPPREHLFPAELVATTDPAAGGDEPAEDTMAAEGEEVPIPVQSVPTSVVVGPDGAYYVGELTGAPFPVGGASVWRVVPGQEPTEYATGFTNIIDLGFGPDGTLYVAEIAHEGLMDFYSGQGDVAPAGAVLSVPPGGGQAELLVSGGPLTALGGLAVDSDGSIYVSANTLDRESGTVVKITP
jgi:DNA-binding beta-propeller fold protein YncE